MRYIQGFRQEINKTTMGPTRKWDDSRKFNEDDNIELEEINDLS
jgi:hypothetical protein